MTIKELMVNLGIYRIMLFVVDYCDPASKTIECLIVEAGSYDLANDEAIQELKHLGIPKRYILKIEEF